jgi:hypothetical protein
MGKKNRGCVDVIVTVPELPVLRVCSIGAEALALMLEL